MAAIVLMLPLAYGESYQQVSSGSSVEVVVTPAESKIMIDFIDTKTGNIQVHVDYTVEVTNGQTQIFGPIPLTHTSPGQVTIPAALQDGINLVTVEIHGIWFVPIAAETAVLEIPVGEAAGEQAAQLPQEGAIPPWIKSTAGWWAEGMIADSDFLGAIEYLVGNGIIEIETSPTAQKSTEGIPDWIRSTAGWWAEGSISDSDFIGALEYMIAQGIISIDSRLAGIDLAYASPVLGSPDADITIIKFGDFQCPNCQSWFANTRPEIHASYIEPGLANLYFVDLVFIGADSAKAAAASYCAQRQGMYWEYHDILYQNQGGIQDGWASYDSLRALAEKLDMDMDSFEGCISEDHQDRILFNREQADAASITRTPSFVIVGPEGAITISGNQPYETFEREIQGLSD